MTQDFLALRIESGPHIIVAAANKAASLKPLKIAQALEDLRCDFVVAPVRRRVEDHQRLLRQVVNAIAPVDGKAVKLGGDSADDGFRTDAVDTGNALAQGTECQLVRP